LRQARRPALAGLGRSRALVYQWSLWSQTEIDRRDWQKERRSGEEASIRRAHAETVAALRVLDDALGQRPYLLGADFTLADLNVAATLCEPHEEGVKDWSGVDPAECGFGALVDWLARCTARPPWSRVRTLP
jgi:glutathione S-transferase